MKSFIYVYVLLLALLIGSFEAYAQSTVIPTGVVTSIPTSASSGIPSSAATTGIPTSVPGVTSAPSSETILTVLEGNGFDDTVAAIDAAGLTSLYNNPSASLTFFAANDTVWAASTASQALAAIPTTGPTSTSSSSSAVSFLTRVIEGATFNRSISLSSLSSGTHNFTSLVGLSLTITKNSSGVFAGPFKVVKQDVAVGSSFINVLDGLLVPPAPTSTSVPTSVTSAPSSVTSIPTSITSVPISTGLPSGVVSTAAPTTVAGVPNGASIILAPAA
eukprot:jgi/Galph1/439/GphlegSOOS_G5159.1